MNQIGLTRLIKNLNNRVMAKMRKKEPQMEMGELVFSKDISGKRNVVWIKSEEGTMSKNRLDGGRTMYVKHNSIFDREEG